MQPQQLFRMDLSEQEKILKSNTPLLTDKFLNKYKNKSIPWGFGILGYIVYKRCVEISTPVLCDDLIWRAAGELKPKDGIIGFDEEPVIKDKNKQRYIRFGKVISNKIEEAECLGIELEDGTVLYATPEHSWLVKYDNNPLIFWRETKDLLKTKYGNPVYLLRNFGKPWKTDYTWEAGFISGAYDGEGNLDRTNEIQFVQVENCMLSKVENILQQKNIPFTKSEKSLSTSYTYSKPRQKCFTLRTHGTKNVFRFLGSFRPERLLNKFTINLEKYCKEIKGKLLRCSPEDYIKVKKIFPAGKRKIAVLSTDIKTHFTGGFASHNTYSRVKENGNTEEWWETVQRCIEGAQKIGACYSKEEAERLYDYIFNLKCNFGGRMLWQLGTTTVDRFGGNSLLNCWMVQMNELNAFEFLFENLMLGGGVGFSVRREDVHELPKVKPDVKIFHDESKDATIIVPDSREGWVMLLHHVLKAFFITGKSFTYSTVLVRGAGEPIKGFGGKASGPKILVDGITQICKIINAREGKKLRSIDVLDICNIIGSIVVSGNVRRSAQIALGDPDDYLFLRAKRWDLGNIQSWRAMSNNTITADAYDHIMESVWDGYAGNGEPYGFFNLPLAKKFGRLKDGPLKESDNVVGLNPCGEITLANYECCNLCELYLNNINSYEELVDCSLLLYKTQKAINALNFIHDETNKIVHKNMRIGLGITGICQSLDKLDWLDKCYLELKKFDKYWSKSRGWPESIKLTTTKPSGTLSLLAGASAGVHPMFDSYYIRRVRMSSNDKLAGICRELGYKVDYAVHQDGSPNRDTIIVEFPCKSEKGILAKDMPAIKQLELVKKIQTIWSDNAVSVTVYYKKEELSNIKDWLKENYKDSLKSVSFVLHSEHNFLQPPYESISEEEYNNRIKDIKPLKQNINGGILENLECSSGACPIR